MLPRLQRHCALLLAMFYLTFAGGIEFLHHHTDGVFPHTQVIGSASGRTPDGKPGIGKAPLTKRQAPDSECAACQWAQNGHATAPSVPSPDPAPLVESSFILFSTSFSPVYQETASSRGPPLS